MIGSDVSLTKSSSKGRACGGTCVGSSVLAGLDPKICSSILAYILGDYKAAVLLVTTLAELSQATKVSVYEGSFLGSRPSLQFRFSFARQREVFKNLNSFERFRRIPTCSLTRFTTRMIAKALLQISRSTHVNLTVPEPKEVNYTRAPRQARGHSTSLRKHIP